MKKTFLLLAVSLFLFGCATARDSQFYDHNSMYKNWSHLWFSWVGYKHCTTSDLNKSKEQGWWGIPQEPCPKK